MPRLEKFWRPRITFYKKWILHLETTNTSLMKMKGENLNDLSNKREMLKMIGHTQISEENRTSFTSKGFRISKITKITMGSGANYF